MSILCSISAFLLDYVCTPATSHECFITPSDINPAKRYLKTINRCIQGKGVSGVVMTEVGRTHEGCSMMKFNRWSIMIWSDSPICFIFSLPLISPTTGQYRTVTSTSTPKWLLSQVPASTLTQAYCLDSLALSRLTAAHYPNPSQISAWTIL